MTQGDREAVKQPLLDTVDEAPGPMSLAARLSA